METRNDNPIVLNDYRLDEPEHPGRILQAELKSRGIRQKEFCGKLGVQPSYLSAIIHGTRNITAGFASRLESALGIPATVWLNLQNLYDLESLRNDAQSAARPYPLRSYPYAGSLVLRDENAATETLTVTRRVTLPADDAEILYKLSSRLKWTLE